MSSRNRLALVALLLLPLPLPAGDAEPSAVGPDEEGAWALAFDVSRSGAGPAAARLEVLREDADGALASQRDLGALELADGASRVEVTFLPAEGIGRYTVALLLDDARVGEVVFDVESAAAAQEVTFDVPDAPTWINLTNDDVNAPGKTKSPGEPLLTRALVSDENGLGEVGDLRWTVLRGGLVTDSGSLPVGAPANATSAPLELRYARAPIAAGAYTLHLAAHKEGAVVAEASRTFAIREVAPTFVSGAIADVTPDEARSLATTVVLADRNGAVGPGTIEARVYRGSSRAEGSGFAATLGAPGRLADAGDAARWSYPIELRIPARAAAGAMRVSIYHNDSLLASLPFEVQALPQLRDVVASTQGGRLVLAPNATGQGILTATLRDVGGAESRATSSALNAPIALEAPRRGPTLRWTVELRAREGGPVLAERNGTWSAPFDGPELRVAPIHVRKHLPAVWALDANGWNASAAVANVTFTRWDGAEEPALSASVAHGRLRVEGPRDLPAGRYAGHLVLTWPNGSASEAGWSFEAGPWIELALGAPVVEGSIARVPVENVGSVAVRRLLVETSSPAKVTLRFGNETFVPRDAGGRQAFSGVTLEPGAEGELVVELPPGPRAAGRASVAVRVMARLGTA